MTVETNLSDIFSYSPEDGSLYRAVGQQNRLISCKDRDGYIVVKVGKKNYFAHRLCWYLAYGTWPTKQIDHVNGVRDDNRLCNLREATPSQNAHNQRNVSKRNKYSKYLGVSRSHSGKWRANIVLDRRYIYLGTFETEEKAHSVYVQAKRKLHSYCTL